MLGPHRSELRRPLVIRRAGPADAAAIARVYVDSWRETYQEQLPASYLAGLSYDAFERHWRRTFAARGWGFVAAVGDEIVGIASGGRARRQNLAGGEIYVLYVLRRHQGRGIGRRIVCRLMSAIEEMAPDSPFIGVFATPEAIPLYRSLGMDGAFGGLTGMAAVTEPGEIDPPCADLD